MKIEVKQMKKTSEVEFLSKWKPLHEKGVQAYVVSNTLYSLITVFIIIFLTKGTLMRSILAFVLGTLMFVVLHILIWSSKEKKYKEIEKVNAEISH
jgi:zinc transporter ZupT